MVDKIRLDKIIKKCGSERSADVGQTFRSSYDSHMSHKYMHLIAVLNVDGLFPKHMCSTLMAPIQPRREGNHIVYNKAQRLQGLSQEGLGLAEASSAFR